MLEKLYQSLREVDDMSLNFSPEGLLFMNITLAVIMFGVAMDIKKDQFRRIVYRPKSVVLGIISQFVVLPGLTFVLVLALEPPPSIAIGMILISVCPGGNISNFISSLAKANVALSVSLTGFATLAATFLTPANFALWAGLYVHHTQKAGGLNIPIEIDFLQMAQTVFILLGIPLILGMWFTYKFPKFTKKIKRPFKIGSLLLYIVFIAGALAANWSFIPLIIIPVGILTVFLNTQTLLTGYLVGTVFRVPRPDRRTLTIETGIQNSGLALVLIFNPKLFDANGGMAVMAAWWGIWQMLSGIVIATLVQHRKIPESEIEKTLLPSDRQS